MRPATPLGLAGRKNEDGRQRPSSFSAAPYQPAGCATLLWGLMAQPQAALALPVVTMRELPSPMPTMQPADDSAVACAKGPTFACHDAGAPNSGELLDAPDTVVALVSRRKLAADGLLVAVAEARGSICQVPQFLAVRSQTTMVLEVRPKK